MKVAFASINGRSLDSHFGQCPSFSIFEFSEKGYKWLESRSVLDRPVNGEEHDKADLRVKVIKDCKLLFVNNIGNDATKKVMKAGIMILKAEEGSELIPHLEKLLQMLKERPPLWLTKVLYHSEEQ